MSDFTNGEGLGPLLDNEAVNIDEEILQYFMASFVITLGGRNEGPGFPHIHRK